MNPAPGGGTSPAASLGVNNGLPGPITLSPNTVTQGATTPTTIVVSGSNFMTGSIVQVGSSSRATTYVSSTQLTFQLTVADQANVATLYITVVNSPPGGGNSTALLNVAAATATPVISSVTPTQFIVGSSGSFLEVQGTGLTANSVVEWNGTPLAGLFLISPGYLLS